MTLYELCQIWLGISFLFLIYYTAPNPYPKGVNNLIELCIYCIIWPFHVIKILFNQIKGLFQ